MHIEKKEHVHVDQHQTKALNSSHLLGARFAREYTETNCEIDDVVVQEGSDAKNEQKCQFLLNKEQKGKNTKELKGAI